MEKIKNFEGVEVDPRVEARAWLLSKLKDHREEYARQLARVSAPDGGLRGSTNIPGMTAWDLTQYVIAFSAAVVAEVDAMVEAIERYPEAKRLLYAETE